VVDHLYGYAPGGGPREWSRGIAEQRLPRFFIDFSFKRRLEALVGVLRAKEIGVANEEILLVVVSVDELGCDALGVIRSDFARVRVEYVHALYAHADASIRLVLDVDIRFAEYNKEVALAGVL